MIFAIAALVLFGSLFNLASTITINSDSVVFEELNSEYGERLEDYVVFENHLLTCNRYKGN